MRNQVSNLLRLGKGPLSIVLARRPKSQLSWWKRYEGLDFRVNGSGPEHNKRPTEPGFKVEPIFTQLGSEVDILEPMEDEEKNFEVLENWPEEDISNEDMKWVAGWA